METMPLINTQFTLFGGHKETVMPGWHWKPEAHLAFELMYIIHGTQKTISEIGDLLVHAGEFIIIPYGISHNNFVFGNEPMTYFAVHFNLDDPTIKYLLTQQYGNQIINSSNPEYIGLQEHTNQMIKLFKDEYTIADKLNLQVTMINLIMFLVNHISNDRNLGIREPNIDQFLLCQKIATEIKAQLDNQIYYVHRPKRIKLASIIADFNISQSYALELFNKYYQKSPQAYLIDLKLNAAKYLLRQPQTQVNEVSERLAYSDPSHFGREFRKHFQITPKQYIQQQIDHAN